MPWTIDDLPEDRFVAGWRFLVGEAPAAMLDDRRSMIALLVETCPVLAFPVRHIACSAETDPRRKRHDP